MDKKRRKGTSKALPIVMGMCLTIFIAYLLLTRSHTPETESRNAERSNQTGEMNEPSEDCPVSSSGIRLCDLSAEQREREELKDRLNAELMRMQNGSDGTGLYAPEKKAAAQVILSPTSKVRLKVGIPSSDYASLVAEKLKNAPGISDVYWSPPDLYDIKYDNARTSAERILSENIFREYNATVISSS